MSSAIAGKKIVFTGKMESGDRKDLEARATELGADVVEINHGTEVGDTDILVHGVQVWAVTLAAADTLYRKAEALGVTVLDETAYLALISDDAVAAPEGD